MKNIIVARRVLEGKGWGGCEIRLMEYFKRADFKKVNITILTNQDIYSERLDDLNIPIKVVERSLSGAQPNVKDFFKMYKLFREFKPNQIIFVQGANTDFHAGDIFAGFLASRGNNYALEVLGTQPPPEKGNKKYFGIIPSVEFWRHRHMFLQKLKGTLSKKVLTSSGEVRRRLVDWYKYPEHKVVPIFHGVDIEHLKRENDVRKELRAKMGIGLEDKVFITTARLSEEKNIDLLINAFNKTVSKRKDVWLLILGDGAEQDRLEALAHAKASTLQIVFLGFVEDVSPYLMMSDVYMLVSNVEGLGIALLEAMACELTCVATKTAGPTEIINHKEDGFLIDKGQNHIEDILKNILSLNNNKLKQIGKKARKKIEENFEKETRVAFAMKHLEIPRRFS